MTDNKAELTDEEIIERFQAGEKEIYSLLIDRHYNKAFQIAFALLRSREDAEEVAQDSFAKIFTALENFRGQAKFSTWMYRIVTNYAKNRYRWNKTRGSQKNVSMHSPIDGKDNGEFFLEFPANSLQPAEQSSFSELEKGIYENLAKITVNYREALVLRNVKGLSYEEIADILDCKIGTVKSRIARGREELRQLLLKQGLL